MGNWTHVYNSLKNQHWGKRGYLCVSLWQAGKMHTKGVHRLVCEAFHGAAPVGKNDAAHRDGDRSDNRSKNLCWKSRAENEADKIAHGRSNRGDRNGMAKVTDADARKLIAMASLLPRSSGGTRMKKGALAPLAAQFGLTLSGTRLIISGHRRVNNVV